ncbi:hypothetical protein KAFR_0A07690 [Kazachstania africana CBS 2517]|uniref:Uncharacterized protein n=1 Tax=Kazachstania africana (strain ATCC 22294 / BCRC 22015 / CBS 2517 / CECT 1963 / NBRC 1671 / NRRL Y-8276) TaxID=1071382 RepID=H2APA3_KAZAF|nr:hypothetical protein KAFR_0A07690 [Kazachstania africana CBS 2517]CCF56203.1 hypothetical protein KAFR_0A07690 [Kazachstania africana CBS 2517]
MQQSMLVTNADINSNGKVRSETNKKLKKRHGSKTTKSTGSNAVIDKDKDFRFKDTKKKKKNATNSNANMIDHSVQTVSPFNLQLENLFKGRNQPRLHRFSTTSSTDESTLSFDNEDLFDMTTKSRKLSNETVVSNDSTISNNSMNIKELEHLTSVPRSFSSIYKTGFLKNSDASSIDPLEIPENKITLHDIESSHENKVISIIEDLDNLCLDQTLPITNDEEKQSIWLNVPTCCDFLLSK